MECKVARGVTPFLSPVDIVQLSLAQRGVLAGFHIDVSSLILDPQDIGSLAKLTQAHVTKIRMKVDHRLPDANLLRHVRRLVLEGWLENPMPLMNCEMLEELDLRHCHTDIFTVLPHLGKLKSIAMHYWWKSCDISAFQYLRRLLWIDLSSTNIKCLWPLSGIPLEYANLSDCSIESIEPLKSSPIKHLLLHECRALTFMISLPRLEILDIGNCWQLGELGEWPNLITMDMSNVPAPIEPLACCSNLRSLVLCGCSQIESIEPLRRCTKLEYLDIRGLRQVQSISALSVCTDLKVLQQNGLWQVQSIEPLRSCSNLEHLDMNGCLGVDCLRALADCSKLVQLSINDCRSVSDLSPLASCTNLKSISLNYCRNIRDLSSLDKCTQLHNICMRGCHPHCNHSAASIPINLGIY